MSTPSADTFWTGIVWRQFGAAIDMLGNAMRDCPDELWEAPMLGEEAEDAKYSVFWYVAYHTLFFLDLYLTGAVEGFAPPAPFTLDELDPAGILPERPYTRDELSTYLEHGRAKCRRTIEALSDEQAWRRCGFPWGELSFAELLVYSMRHVQEHGAQLSLFLGQQRDIGSRWVAQARE